MTSVFVTSSVVHDSISSCHCPVYLQCPLSSYPSDSDGHASTCLSALRPLPITLAGASPVWHNESLLLFGGFSAEDGRQQSNRHVIELTLGREMKRSVTFAPRSTSAPKVSISSFKQIEK